MGTLSSKHSDNGVLPGAYAPPLEGIPLPPPLHPKKQFNVKVPQGKKAGDTMTFQIHGEDVNVVIPKEAKEDGTFLKAGDKFRYTHPAEINKVIASTLPTLPGAVIVEAKPIIWAAASKGFFRNAWSDPSEQISMSKELGKLMAECQTVLLEKAIDVECNAVLGIVTNVTTDSSGDRGHNKFVMVTMTGTPCRCVASANLPAVKAEAVIVPNHFY